MLFILLFILLTTALLISIFLLSEYDVETLKDILYPKRQLTFPLVTLAGDIVDSKEDLDVRLETLKTKLVEKKHALEETQSKILTAVESMDKLNTTSEEIRRYYWKLKSEVARSELDCQDIQQQIEDFQKKQQDLNEEIRRNDGLCKAIFKDFKVCDSKCSSRTTMKSFSNASFSF